MIREIVAAYFSPTENTKKCIMSLAKTIGEIMTLPVIQVDFTMPGRRDKPLLVNEDQLLIIGLPIYAGRLPNKIMPFVRDMVKADDGNAKEKTYAIGLVTYGNRSYGDGLKELVNILKDGGFKTIGATAVPCQHAFAEKLAKDKPDDNTMKKIIAYGNDIAKIFNTADYGLIEKNLLEVPGNEPIGPYYAPKREDGMLAVFLKAKPKTLEGKCINCGICAANCPMGSISFENTNLVTGICIKCQSCVNHCPRGSKYFDHEDFISHKNMLEKNFQQEKEIEFYTIGA